jgi:hypothetical protein
MISYLVNFGSSIRDVVADAGSRIKEYAFAIQEELVERIQSGPKTGVVTKSGHRRSRKGESPANEFGILANSIAVRLLGERSAEVYIGAAYADILDTDLQRPFVAPAIEAVLVRAN